MNFFDAIILGVIEGFTEYLPISSTAHLVLASHILKISQTDFVKSFEIIVQSGAILAVIVLYWRKFMDAEVLKRLIIAFIPTAVVGYVFYAFIKSSLIGNLEVTLWVLGIGGIFLIIFERFMVYRKFSVNKVEEMNYRTCIIIGVFQAIAVVPGVSRAAATIVGGMLVGVRREAIVEFSFLLAVPTLLAATGLDYVNNFNSFSSADARILTVGFLVALLSAMGSITLLMHYIRRHTLSSFGVYRVLVAVVFLIQMRIFAF